MYGPSMEQIFDGCPACGGHSVNRDRIDGVNVLHCYRCGISARIDGGINDVGSIAWWKEYNRKKKSNNDKATEDKQT